MDNYILNCYFDQRVQMKREETRRNVEYVLPVVDEILRYVHNRDVRFLIQPLRVGSYDTHLKVKKADEFDYNVIVDVGKRFWRHGIKRYYGFNDNRNQVLKRKRYALSNPPAGHCFTKFESIKKQWEANGLNDDVIMTSMTVNDTRDHVVERKCYALPDPPVGHYFTEIGSIKKQWDIAGLNDGVASMTFENYIVPIKVKRRFKSLIGEAVNQPKFRNMITTDRISSSPATTLSVKFQDIPYPISIDLCPMIESQLEFQPEFHWPRPNSRWPSQHKIAVIKTIGVNEMAKEPFYWTLSFAACEKELLDGIDIGGTCRKKSQRIMKQLKEDVWCPQNLKSELTSYHLKNVLFWECEDTEWQQNLLETRVRSMTYRLLGYLQKGNLPLYFHTGVNLLSSKDKGVLQKVEKNIKAFLDQPRKYLIV